MGRNIKTIAAIAVVGVLSTWPAVAQTTSPSPQQSNTSTTTPDPNASNGGAASAYNFEVPSPAPATCCGGSYDHQNANGNAVNIMKNFNQKLAAVQLALIEAMRLSTGQLSGNFREQTGATHTLADQQDDRSTVKAVESARMTSIKDSATGVTSCYVISGTPGAGTETQSNKFRYALANEAADLDQGADGTPSAKGTAFAVQARVDMHCAKYATEADIAAGICPSGATDKALKGADINVAKSLFYSKDGGSMTLDDDHIKASKAFLVNSFTPNPLGRMKSNEGKTLEGREKAAKRNAVLANNSIAIDVVSDFIARRTANKDNKLVSWAQDKAKKMAGFENMDLSAGVSKLDWLAIYSRGFLTDADALASSDQSQVTSIKDIKNMMAVQLYQNFENYLLMEKIALNLATQTSILVKQEAERLTQ